MEDGPGVSINRTGGFSSPTCCVMTFCPSFSCAYFARSNLGPPAKALSETFPATAGTPIFAQSPHPRNGQFGWDTNQTIWAARSGRKRARKFISCADFERFPNCSWNSRLAGTAGLWLDLILSGSWFPIWAPGIGQTSDVRRRVKGSYVFTRLVFGRHEHDRSQRSRCLTGYPTAIVLAQHQPG